MLPAIFYRRRVPNGSRLVTGFEPLHRMLNLFDDDVCCGHARAMAVDIREHEDRFVIEAELPGEERDNIDVTVEDGVLTIEAKHASEDEDQGEGYHIRERRSGSVSRSFRLPDDVDADRIEADMKNGLLTLTIPKSEAAKPKTIQVRVQ